MSRLFKTIMLAAMISASAALPAVPGGLVSTAQAQSETGIRRGTGLPLPRYVSLKSDNVNVRRGPGQDYDLAFKFVRAGLPVEIVQEFDNWRKIRDAEGDEGWVFHSLLAGRRTALIAPWETRGTLAARSSAQPSAAVTAYLEPRVVANVQRCTGSWCLLRGNGFSGWIEQEKLWGVYPDERFSE